MRVPLFIISAAALLVTAAPGHTQETAGSSSRQVKELADYLTSHNQSAIAAKDSESGDFVAALFYPGGHLRVAAGRPPVPGAVDAQLAAGNFQDVYSALQD